MFTGANQLFDVQQGQFDAHAHVFQCDLPMLATRRCTPSADAPLDILVDHLSTHNLNGALLIQPSFLGTDNQFLVSSIERASQRWPELTFRGVAVVDPDVGANTLKELDRAGIVGCRLNLLGIESEFDARQWQSAMSRLDQLDWHVEVHCRAQALDSVVNAIAPSVRRIVVDHFGLPNGETGHKDLLALAKRYRTQLFVKLSAPYRFLRSTPADQWSADCRPLVQDLLANLGANQMMWGSDWPWTQFESQVTYRDAIGWRNSWMLQSDETVG